jgi:hypothetical protein
MVAMMVALDAETSSLHAVHGYKTIFFADYVILCVMMLFYLEKRKKKNLKKNFKP